MAITSVRELKTYFERGDRPTQRQFQLLIDSLSVSTTGEQSDIQNYNQIISDYAIKSVAAREGQGEVELISNPQITAGVDGQKIILYGDNDTDTVILKNGNGLDLTADFQLTQYATIYLVYVESRLKWIEVGRKHGGGSPGVFDIERLPESFTSLDSDFIAIYDGIEHKKITKANFLDSVGGQFNLAIQDEGTEILSSVNMINFTGVDVEVTEEGVTGVNVFIPPPDYSSHFGTNDGTTNATINDISTNQRYVSLPTSEGTPFNIGDWNGTTLRSIINTTSFTLSTNEEFTIINNTNNVLSVKIYDADNTTMLTSHSIFITGNTDVTSNNIRIQVIDFTTDANRYKANAIFTIDIDYILSTGGRFIVELENDTITDGVYTKTQGPMFYDPDVNSSNISGLTIDETLGQVILKQISGVYYYTLNSQFTVNIASINYLNDRSFPAVQVQIDGSEYGLTQLNLSGSDLSGWNNYFDDITDSYNKTDWTITQSNYYLQSQTANIQTQTIDWSNSAWVLSDVKNILIDTYTNNNTATYEDFRNETKRFYSDLITIWDSTELLNTIDSGNGLQQKNSKLIYPQEDFTIFYPEPTLQPNYSILSNSKTYYSYFYHTGISHSNGRIRLSDYNLSETNLTNESCIIEISLDGINWYNLNNLYLGGSLSNGDGCRINSGVYSLILNDQIEFTLGTGGFTDISTGNGWGIWYRITFDGSVESKSVEIGSIEIVNWI